MKYILNNYNKTVNLILKTLYVFQKLKVACYFEVSTICTYVCENNTLLGELNIDKQAKQLITELIWKKLQVYSKDLEAFAK